MNSSCQQLSEKKDATPGAWFGAASGFADRSIESNGMHQIFQFLLKSSQGIVRTPVTRFSECPVISRRASTV